MGQYQLRYPARPGVVETIDALDPDDAEDLARLRLLFSEPGFVIAIVADGREVRRLTQAPRPGREGP